VCLELTLLYKNKNTLLIISVYVFKILKPTAIYVAALNYREISAFFFIEPCKIDKCTVWAECRKFYGAVTLNTA
jgi:hypothetical protein